MLKTQSWLLAVEDRIATLTLNREAKLNTIKAETLHELRDLTRQIAADDSIWAVIVEGKGDHFSAGVDVNLIQQMVGQNAAAFQANLRDLQDCLDQFEALEKPTIAKIRGYCVGGGLLLALCCDFRIASEGASFVLPEVKRGIAVIMGTQRITRIAGIAAAKELVMLAEPISAEQAYRYNLLHRVVPAEELDATVTAFAHQFRHLPPRTVGIAKRIIQQGNELSLRESQELELAAQSELLNSADFQEGVASFFEKRPPIFMGK